MSTIKVSTIDTPTASDFAVKTASATRLTISQSGHIGVRTASPLAPLHVSDLSAEIRITAPSITGADWGILPQTNNTTPLFRIFDRYNSLDRLTISSAGLVTATSFAGNGTIPIGGIIMWSGTTIPTGWAFCDGTTVNGTLTPNLTNKFIISRSAGTVTTTSVTGAATSTGGTATASLVDHRHVYGMDDNTAGISVIDNYAGTAINGDAGSAGGGGLYRYNTSKPKKNTGAAFSEADVTVVPESNTANLPPYYALAFIMRVA